MSILIESVYNKDIVKDKLLKYSFQFSTIISNLKLSNAQCTFMNQFENVSGLYIYIYIYIYMYIYIYIYYIYQYYTLTLPVLYITSISITH